MNSRYGSAARVVLVLERGIPRQGFGCRAGYARHARHTAGGTVAWEMLGEDRTIIIFLLVLWRVDRESLGSMRHLLIADGRCSNLLQGVNPRIAYTIGELLLLAPCYFFRKQIGKCLTNDLLLDGLVRTHLQNRVHTHGYIN